MGRQMTEDLDRPEACSLASVSLPWASAARPIFQVGEVLRLKLSGTERPEPSF